MPVESCGRRARGLADIAPQYIAKSGLCAATEMESARGGSIRIQHLTGATAGVAGEGRSRFPKLDECAHFHYEAVELGPLQICLYEEELKPLWSEDSENKWWHVSVTSQGKSWVIRRSYDNFRLLDQQLHRCIYDRKFSGLPELPPEDNVPGTNHEESTRQLLSDYLLRFSQLATSTVNCGPVLNWLELDNRGHRLLVPDGDSCPINTPAVAAAYAIRRYQAQAGDEISFEIGDMISVIDMPPPEESVWWRGKRGFQVGFFPSECVAVIGDKVPHGLPIPQQQQQQQQQPPQQQQQQQIEQQRQQPSKPVLRKHGKLIAFFRSFILARPSRRRLRQSGILKERVFGCDLGEHLLNSGHDIPMVLKCCAEFIESNGIVDGIYRLSGVTSNIQKLRNAFDEDRVPALYEDEAILQDIHSVASLLKMYFRELPNPLCTYQLYHTFVGAVQAGTDEAGRLARMRDAVHKLPPPHYRTLQYLVRHLARVASRGHLTGMTPRNVAIVWAPNLLRCKELEVGGVAALQGVGVQAVVTEFLVCYADLIFCEGPPAQLPVTRQQSEALDGRRSRPKSLAISTPTKLLSLEEARSRALMSSGKGEPEYIEVGGGPASLPAKYHTVIELPGGGSARKRSGSKRSPLGWKSFFSKSGRKTGKATTPSDLGLNQMFMFQTTAVTEADLSVGRRRLRPVKSAESLANSSSRNSAAVTDTDLPLQAPTAGVPEDLVRAGGHSRSVSHDSYFDQLAETPARTRAHARPSRLAEEEREEHFSSSLDLSEIQLNFELEETEMRIFSEDETLLSVGSGSLISQGSPRIWPGAALRRGSAAGEASPKRQQRPAGPPSPRSKRSRLEQRLGCSPHDELRYIDSQSPESVSAVGINSGLQVTVHAEVHPLSSPPSTPGYRPLLDSSPETPDPDRPHTSMYQDMSSARSSSTYRDASGDERSPTYHEMSDTKSSSTHQEGSCDERSPGTTFDDLAGRRLTESYCSTQSDADVGVYQNVSLSAYCEESESEKSQHAYENVSSTASPRRHSSAASDSDTIYQEVSRAKSLSCDVPNNVLNSACYDDVSEKSSTLQHSVTSEEGVKDANWNMNSEVCSGAFPVSESCSSDKDDRLYENIPQCVNHKCGSDSSSTKSCSSSLAENDHLQAKTPSVTAVYQNVSPSGSPLHSAFSNVYQNLPNRTSENVYQNIIHNYEPVLPVKEVQNLKPTDLYEDAPEEHVYEDVRPLVTDGIDLYQQVKTLRRSVHEVNQLLGETTVSEADSRISESPSDSSHHETLDTSSNLDLGSDIAGSTTLLDTAVCDNELENNGDLKHKKTEIVSTNDVKNAFVSTRDTPSNDGSISELLDDESCNVVTESVAGGRSVAASANVRTEERSQKSPQSVQEEFASGVTSYTQSDIITVVTDPYVPRGGVQKSDNRLCDTRNVGYDSGNNIVSSPGVAEESVNESEPSDVTGPEEYSNHSGEYSRTLQASPADHNDCQNPPEVIESATIPSGSAMDDCSSNNNNYVGKNNADIYFWENFLSGERNSLSRQSNKENSEDSAPSAETSPHRRKRNTSSGSGSRSTPFLETNLDDTEDFGDSSGSSPVRETSPTSKLPLDSNRRRFESEIGREILRERRMKQELEEIRSQATGGQARSRRPVRSLPARPSDTSVPSQPLPPCVRAREARARRQLSSGSLSSSLDGGRFPSSVLVRATTSPDVNVDSTLRPSGMASATSQAPAHPLPLPLPEDDDPQRRERIERYKQERRTFLREKYRSESFRGERDEMLQRLKRRAGRTAGGTNEQPPEGNSDQASVLSARLHESSAGEPERSPNLSRDREIRRVSDDQKSSDSTKITEKVLTDVARERRICEEDSVVTRTRPGRARYTDRTEEELRTGSLRRSSAPQQGPGCIRDMAALFEARDMSGSTSTPPSQPTTVAAKTYVSSV
ncbi:GTPase-activating protein CdGAPr isoform X8 [Schistocerca gregaria]|uniref:GTPase-activating protein CdGAPr isoform X8 n=1 Tax=Schistocerca gregaria TaxID=7010 RepID=UPI00211E9F66|nr:GTPase-activating protein CdGAPr isoform X8 [Schistocerca gregaria]